MVWPLVSLAQQPNPIRLIGVLIGYAESDPAAQSEIAAFRSRLGELGWMEGRNLRIELRWGGGDATRVKAFARELVELRPDAILSQSTAVTDALTRETKTIPIVFVIVADPVASGFATSLARPGGNVSGFMVETALQGGRCTTATDVRCQQATSQGLACYEGDRS
jgi:putative ABC transport system substrate-binding protein